MKKVPMFVVSIFYMFSKILTQEILLQHPDYTIRKANMSDEKSLKNLYKKVAANLGGLARNVSEITDEYIHKTLFAGVNHGLALIVEVNGNIIGSMIKYHLDPKVFAHILTEGSILVDPDYQGKGIGSKLIATFLHEIEEHHTDILRIEIIARESNPALKLYERMGFKQEGRFASRIRGIDGKFEADIPMAWINSKFIV